MTDSLAPLIARLQERFAELEHPSAQEIHNRVRVTSDPDFGLVFYVRRIDMLHLVKEVEREVTAFLTEPQQVTDTDRRIVELLRTNKELRAEVLRLTAQLEQRNAALAIMANGGPLSGQTTGPMRTYQYQGLAKAALVDQEPRPQLQETKD